MRDGGLKITLAECLEIYFLSMKTIPIVQTEPKLCREAKGSKSQPILIMVTALYLVLATITFIY